MWEIIIVDRRYVPADSCLPECRIDCLIVNTWTMNLIVQGRTPRQTIEVIYHPELEQEN